MKFQFFASSLGLLIKMIFEKKALLGNKIEYFLFDSTTIIIVKCLSKKVEIMIT